MLILEFSAFNVESDGNCGYDSLKIRDGDGTTLMEKSCGSNLPPTIRSRSNIVHLDFKTDGGKEFSGWSLNWRAVTPAL